MTLEEFKSKLDSFDLTLKDFSELTSLSYSTVTKFGKSNPIPPWVTSWIKLYEENQSLTNVKEDIISLAEKLK